MGNIVPAACRKVVTGILKQTKNSFLAPELWATVKENPSDVIMSSKL
jgi:hypothetical protein